MSSRTEITVVSYFEGRLPGGNSPRPPCPGPSRRRGPSRPVQAPRPVPARPGDSGSSWPGPAPARPGVSGTGQAMGGRGEGGALGKSGLQVPHGFVDCDGKPAVLCVVCGTRLWQYHRHLICCSDECDRKAIHGDLLRTTLRPGIRARGPGEPGPGDRGGSGPADRRARDRGTGNRGTVGPGTGGRAGPGGPGAGAGDQGTGRPVGMHTPPAPALRVDTDGAGGQSRGGGLTTSSMVAVGLLDKAREMEKWLIEEEGIPARSHYPS